jgi:hypothetical protein
MRIRGTSKARDLHSAIEEAFRDEARDYDGLLGDDDEASYHEPDCSRCGGALSNEGICDECGAEFR